MPHSQTPPHNTDAEMEILGAILKYPDALDEVIYTVKPQDFYVPKHRTIYNACIDLYHKGEPCDIIHVAEKVGKESLPSVGGRAYLSELSGFSVTSTRIKHHASILKEKATARTLLKTIGEISNHIYTEDKGIGEVLLEAEDRIFKLTEHISENRFQHVRETLPEVLKEIEDYQSGEAEKNLIMTGFGNADHILQGFVAGELIVVASNTGHGKTQFVLQVLENNAKRGKAGAIFALEMTAGELVKRLLSSESGISSDVFRRKGGLQDSQWDSLAQAGNRIGDLPIFIDDSPILTTAEIISKSRKIKAQHSVDLLVVDYAQLMKGKGDNRNLEVADITRTLKIVAKDIDVPVIVVSQLTRDNAKQEREPRLSDLRDSGAIEQDADTVLFPFHKPIKSDDGSVELESKIIVGKRRKGGRGDYPIKMNFKNGIWYDWMPEVAEPAPF